MPLASRSLTSVPERSLDGLMTQLRNIEEAFGTEAPDPFANVAEADPRDDVLARIGRIREQLTNLLDDVRGDPAGGEDCRVILGILDHLRGHVEAWEQAPEEPPKTQGQCENRPCDRLVIMEDYVANLNDPVHRLEEDRYKDFKQSKTWRKRALKVTGAAFSIVGVGLIGAGAAVQGIGFVGLSSSIGAPAAIGLLAGGGAAEMVGLAMAGGTGAAVYFHQNQEPASKKFVRKYRPEQMEEAAYDIAGTRMVADFRKRQKMVRRWAKDNKVNITREEQVWYACRDNFDRFLTIRRLDGTKQQRKDMAKLMNLERNHVIWACNCPDEH